MDCVCTVSLIVSGLQFSRLDMPFPPLYNSLMGISCVATTNTGMFL